MKPNVETEVPGKPVETPAQPATATTTSLALMGKLASEGQSSKGQISDEEASMC